MVTSWEPCSECGGARVQGEHCYAHLTSGEWAEQRMWLRDGTTLDVRGVTIDDALLRSIVDAFSDDEDGFVRWPPSEFREATFTAKVSFNDVHFSGAANFDGTRFAGGASFDGASFSQPASFEAASFRERADFRGTQFLSDVSFDGASFYATADFTGARCSGEADFTGTAFVGPAHFLEVQFSGEVDFTGARFSAPAFFEEAVFSDETSFDDARFAELANFSGAIFSDGANFDGTRFLNVAFFDQAQFSGFVAFSATLFHNEAGFSAARFSDPVLYQEVQFFERADFRWTAFEDEVSFDNARFYGPADFVEAKFSGESTFEGTGFSQIVMFTGATFNRRVTVGPLVGSGTLNLDGAYFREGARLDVAAPRVSCSGTRFGGRTDLNLRWTEIVLDDATFVAPSRLAGVGPFADMDDAPAQMCHLDRRLDADPRPRLLSLRQANVENLALSNIDLRACRFFGAHGIDQLRIEADCEFAYPPRRRRYTRRRTLAEEQHWRARSEGPDEREQRWYPPVCRPASWLTPDVEALAPPGIAALYRALRKALEDRRDEPGAADFYYGEMEMRRVGPSALVSAERQPRDRPERTLLALYWLLAGYGLRASRSLTAFVLVIALVAAAIARWGFSESVSYGHAVLFALQSSVSLLHPPEVQLTATGEALEVLIRITGPLLFGLALISLRGRVKR